MKKPKIVVLHNSECEFWQEAVLEAKKALISSGMQLWVEIIEVKSPNDAKKYKFSGSPQVNVNGKDVDPEAKNVKKPSLKTCRPYTWGGKSFDYPPKEMILAALQTLKTNH